MRRIFVALHGPDDAATLLHLAGRLASPFGAQIEAAFINEVAGIGEEPATEDVPGAAAAHAAFETWAASLAAGAAGPAIKASWREIPDGVVYASASLGRASDLIVAQSARRAADDERVPHNGRDRRRFRDALLASGRLTLLAPAGFAAAAGLLDHVAVAWDGSAGAAHSLAQALPLLARAARVRVVIIGRNTVGEGAREAIGSYVALHCPGATLAIRDNAHRQTGRALLDALREEQASLVVMGVSGRSHTAAGAGTAGAALGGTILKVIEDGRIPILAAV